jgi:hypothetical protein
VRVYSGDSHSKVREREGDSSTFRRSHDTASKLPDRCHGFFEAVYSGCDGTHIVSIVVGIGKGTNQFIVCLGFQIIQRLGRKVKDAAGFDTVPPVNGAQVGIRDGARELIYNSQGTVFTLLAPPFTSG